MADKCELQSLPTIKAVSRRQPNAGGLAEGDGAAGVAFRNVVLVEPEEPSDWIVSQSRQARDPARLDPVGMSRSPIQGHNLARRKQ